MMWCWPPPPCQTFVLCLCFGTSIYVRRLHKIMWSIMYKFSVLIRLLISLLSLCSFLAYLYLYFFCLSFLSFPFLSCRSFIAFLPFLAFLCLSCFSLCFFWCLFFLIILILTFLSFLSSFPFCFFRSRGILKTHDKVLWHLRISVQAHFEHPLLDMFVQKHDMRQTNLVCSIQSAPVLSSNLETCSCVCVRVFLCLLWKILVRKQPYTKHLQNSHGYRFWGSGFYVYALVPALRTKNCSHMKARLCIKWIEMASTVSWSNQIARTANVAYAWLKSWDMLRHVHININIYMQICI